MPDHDIVFLALARNCARWVPGMVAALRAFTDAGLQVHVLVGENGSTDGTRAALRTAPADLVTLVETDFLGDMAPRTRRLALGREFLKDAVVDHPARSVGVIDLDEPFFAAVDTRTLQGVLDRIVDETYFARSATSRPTYYDLLAYEDDERSFTGLDTRIRDLERSPLAYYRFFRRTIYPQQSALTSDVNLVCKSAFNGLCIYRYSDYIRGSYLTDETICEHVTFNRSLAAATGSRMLVDAALVLPTPEEHGARTPLGFVVQRVRKLIRRVAGRST